MRNLRNYRRLKSRVDELTRENENLYDCIYNTDVNLNNLDQYSRRVNVEIKNISESINQSNIENHVIEVFKSIGVKVQSYDLVAVHRLGKYIQRKNRNVIVRFINRKNPFACLRNSKKLAVSNLPEYKKLFIIENLCPANKKVFNYLYCLKKENKINSVWTFDGIVFFKKSESSDDYGQKVLHFDDIDYYLSEYSESDGEM